MGEASYRVQPPALISFSARLSQDQGDLFSGDGSIDCFCTD